MPKQEKYQVLYHSDTPECSLRLLRVESGESIDPHYHKETTQIYFVVEGSVLITVGDESRTVRPQGTIRVPREIPHSLQTQSAAVVLSISIPPLLISDHHNVPVTDTTTKSRTYRIVD